MSNSKVKDLLKIVYQRRKIDMARETSAYNILAVIDEERTEAQAHSKIMYFLLEKVYNEIYQNRPVVTYCGSGVTACNALLTMSEVGLESALYVGSSSDWVTYDEFPLKTGVETLR